MAKKRDENDNLFCSFCGKNQKEVKTLVAGPAVYICDECVQLCHEIIEEESIEETIGKYSLDESVEEIVAEIDKKIIGQDHVTIKLIRYLSMFVKTQQKKGDMPIGHVLLIGPTGTGKTALIETITKTVMCPYAYGDATRLFYRRFSDKHDLWKNLIQNQEEYKEANNSIVFIDNFDKIASSDKDAENLKSQAFLAELMDGTEIQIADSKIKTDSILFICSGTFENLYKEHPHEKYISRSNHARIRILDKLCHCGYQQGLLDRFSLVLETKPLSLEQLIQLLKDPDKSPLKSYQDLFRKNGLDVYFEDNALSAIAEEAFRRKSGVRGIRLVLDNLAIDLPYQVLTFNNKDTITVTREMVESVLL